MELNKKSFRSIAMLVCGAIILHFTLNNFDTLLGAFRTILKILAPFIMGAGIAVFINVPMRAIEFYLSSVFKDKNISAGLLRGLALILTLILVLVTVYFVFMTVLPELSKAIIKLAEDFPRLSNQFMDWLKLFNENNPNNPVYAEAQKSIEKIAVSISNNLQSSLSRIFMGSLNIITSTLNSMVTVFLAFIFSLYLLSMKESLGATNARALYAFLDNDSADVIVVTLNRMNRVFTKYVGGQVVEAIIFGSLVFIVMKVFRFPYSTTIPILMTFTALIPYFGGLIGLVIGFVLIATESVTTGFYFVVLILILQQIEGNLIYPRVVGNSVGLPPIWVMVSVTIGGSVMGIVGMLLAVPIASVIYKTLGDFVEYKSIRKVQIETDQLPLVKLNEHMKKSFEDEKIAALEKK